MVYLLTGFESFANGHSNGHPRNWGSLSKAKVEFLEREEVGWGGGIPHKKSISVDRRGMHGHCLEQYK